MRASCKKDISVVRRLVCEYPLFGSGLGPALLSAVNQKSKGKNTIVSVGCVARRLEGNAKATCYRSTSLIKKNKFPENCDHCFHANKKIKQFSGGLLTRPTVHSTHMSDYVETCCTSAAVATQLNSSLTRKRDGAHAPVHRQEGPVLVEGSIPERMPVEQIATQAGKL